MQRGSSTTRPTVGCPCLPEPAPMTAGRKAASGKRYERSAITAPSQNSTQGAKNDVPVVPNSSDGRILSETNCAAFHPQGGSSETVLISDGRLSHAVHDQRPHGEGPAIGSPETHQQNPFKSNPISTESGRIVTKLGRCRPNLTNMCRTSIGFGQIFGRFRRIWPNFGQYGPDLDSIGPQLVDSGQIWQSLAKVGPNFAEFGLDVAQVGRCWPKFRQGRPNFGQWWLRLERISTGCGTGSEAAPNSANVG